MITFKIDDSLLGRLDIFAHKRNMVRSEVIRRAIKSYLDREDRKIVTRRIRIY